MPTRTGAHLPFAHCASDATIASTAMAPDTSVLALRTVFCMCLMAAAMCSDAALVVGARVSYDPHHFSPFVITLSDGTWSYREGGQYGSEFLELSLPNPASDRIKDKLVLLCSQDHRFKSGEMASLSIDLQLSDGTTMHGIFMYTDNDGRIGSDAMRLFDDIRTLLRYLAPKR